MVDAGDSLSHFRLVARVRAGDRGDIWTAVDTRADREVALRILPPAFAQDPLKLARFKDTNRALAALDHPNIATIHSVEESGNVHFLSMELVRGTALPERIPRGGLALGAFLELALPLTGAIRAAHEQGLTHGDLRPGNVMLTEEGVVKVLGFGFAEIPERAAEPGADPDDISTLTLERTTRDTMPYMSPEQVQGKSLDHRSDVFSLGTILYEAATGKHPFGGHAPADIFVAILRDEPRPVTALNQALPRQFEKIVHRCLEKDRERRFQTVKNLHDELAQLGGGQDQG